MHASLWFTCTYKYHAPICHFVSISCFVYLSSTWFRFSLVYQHNCQITILHECFTNKNCQFWGVIPTTVWHSLEPSQMRRMYGMFTYIYHKFMVNVGNYSIHSAHVRLISSCIPVHWYQAYTSASGRQKKRMGRVLRVKVPTRVPLQLRISGQQPTQPLKASLPYVMLGYPKNKPHGNIVAIAAGNRDSHIRQQLPI